VQIVYADCVFHSQRVEFSRCVTINRRSVMLRTVHPFNKILINANVAHENLMRFKNQILINTNLANKNVMKIKMFFRS